MIWFGAFGGVCTFVALIHRGVAVAALMGVIMFLVLAVYPVLYAKKYASSDPTPRSSPGWSDIEVAVFTFAFLCAATVVIVGIYLERIVLGAACGLGVFLVLGGLPAVVMRRLRLRKASEPPEELWPYPD